MRRLDRRELVTALGAALGAGLGATAIAGAAPVRAQREPAAPSIPLPLVKPPRLRPGDKVGLVNPATAAFETMPIEILVDSLEALGLRVVHGNSYFSRRGYFAGADEDRARDIRTFFADPEVKALVARGGWGSARLLPLLDYETIRRNPKILLGYSDVTALLLGIHARTGLVTFHGPHPRMRFSADHLRQVLFDADAPLLENPREVPSDQTVQTEHRIQTLVPGVARGPILGGNLTVLTAIVGSGYLPDFRGCVLFLEDVDEAVYRVDRMLTQLRLAGILDQIAGFVFGRCTECEPDSTYGSLTLEEVLGDHVGRLGVPAYQGAMIGHIPEQFTIPLGIEVEMDAAAGTIRLLEPGVV
jgi:muramoyltetrapeptide carboxypeptidase